MAGDQDMRLEQTSATLERCGVRFEGLERATPESRYRQVGFDGIKRGLLEPHSGVLLARRAVAPVDEEAVPLCAEHRWAQGQTPTGSGRVARIATCDGEGEPPRPLV